MAGFSSRNQPRFPASVCCSAARQPQESRRWCAHLPIYLPTYVCIHTHTHTFAHSCPDTEGGVGAAFFHGHLQFK